MAKPTRLVLGIAAAMALTIFGPAQATETNVWLNLEGNPTCSSLGDNQAILELRDNDPVVGTNRITGDRINELGQVVGTQTITYELSSLGNRQYEISGWRIELDGLDGTTLSTVNPVNYTILKAQGNAGARVYHFGGEDEGAIADSVESAPQNATLSAVSFCYGLTIVGFNPGGISLTDLPDCNTLSDTTNDGISDLYTTGITCPPLGGEQQMIVNLNLKAPNFGFDPDNIRACTCNATLKACDPRLPAQDATDPNKNDASCMEYNVSQTSEYDNVPVGVNNRIPWQLIGVENPDSYFCYTWGGYQYCYGEF